MTMKRLFLIAAGVFLIAGAYGCQGLTGPGSGFQGGTEAGNPPTDGGFIGGTEAGNPPVGETTGGPGGGSEDPREGESTCDLPDTPEKEGRFPCPTLEGQRIEMLTPEQMGSLHDKQQEQEEESGRNKLRIPVDPNTLQRINGALGDFGHSEAVDSEDEKVMMKVPSNSMHILNPYDPKP